MHGGTCYHVEHDGQQAVMYVLVAQLAEALDLESRGCGFESHPGY